MRCLYLGKGFHPPRRKLKPVETQHVTDAEIQWTTLDMFAGLQPDIVFDLNRIERGEQIPVVDESFDEIHAYDVLEHVGTLGDFRGFFTGWKELWRILKPGGYVIGAVPLWSSKHAWSDPGHTRVINDVVLSYLAKAWYDENLPGPDTPPDDPRQNTPLTDYRHLVEPHWWDLAESVEMPERGAYFFALKKLEIA